MKALYVTDRQSAGDSCLKETLAAFSGAPGLSVQLRENDAPDRECLGWARLARSILGAGVPLYVNRRFDIALAADADGVHLPASGALPGGSCRPYQRGRRPGSHRTHLQ